ncbi:1-deoxy-D-xylulose-5-phosphate synthase [Desulfofustis limnaeus]|jgi:1-deoxy-D-xylulose-5-phosphate synthase|uniref:1-deoxy-D-xylulose-5-phosphate synthase n=1 Tax=Desulfofustis limnaeus TaxID=2740163 RepID=A0ABN6M648_9BACT|nr:1-deoxy-D-xylulose-5-phosphate synthase [Desulfofustis limnaeus]MDX9893960.1 1-deoxy-D-xylulose-5-phosphate synthase [Desulfofustis sp.]BDD87519.1 1-deoxy-D-xylulose-5-phosphate synthase 1 [Desulfofustis limnaeus]
MLLPSSPAKNGSALLDTIQSPADIRQRPISELEELAAEIRSTIIATVSDNGGHLGPSLGVVELTLALHYVFNTPYDRLIWDVGHQAYAHKLITGRRDRFHTLRQYQGISGFPKLSESEYDTFETGHSSTSISAALGMAMGKDLKDDPRLAIAVIGDGSMTAGMAFEALNQAGHLNKRLIVILNDNEMSISPNVGALSSFLSRKLSGRTMRRLKDHLVERLGQLSNVGENILTVLKKSEESFKSFFTPGMLFEALKFDYIGPLPGHDLVDLIDTFETVRDTIQGPVLIHVLTTKGKGYSFAEKDPGTFHGIAPFDVASGKKKSNGKKIPSYTDVFGDTITRIGRTNDKVVAISAAMVAGTGLSTFAETFPDRFFDVGIAEQHALTFAAGLAIEGFHPVVAIYSTFFQRSYDQIIHDVCIPNLPVTLAIDRAGVVGADGPTHHGVFDLSFLRIIPNMVLMAPKDEEELRHMLFTAIGHQGPSALRYPRGIGEQVALTEELASLPIGKGELLRSGDDITLLPVGNRVHPALRAAAGLEKLGIQAAVINPRFIKPLDKDLICQWAERTGRVVTIEDNVRQGGFGSAVLELLSRCGLSGVKTSLLAHPDRFLEHGPQKTLWRNSSINSVAITEAALRLMNQ